jgi:hypothetical protein
VLIDPELADRRPDWIAYAQRHVAWASQVLEAQIGVRLELRGVLVWSNPHGHSVPTLLTDLQTHPRDGADLVLGLTSRSFAGAPMLTADADHNLGHALVQANPGSRAPHLRGMLHAVGQALGAAALRDAGGEAWRSGSFLGDVLAPDSQPLTLDPDSRERLLARKSLPFADPEPAASAPDDDAPPPRDTTPPSLDDGEL